ncbi:hypothetical protein V8E51_014431 [Hyaloscypha variabilis]
MHDSANQMDTSPASSMLPDPNEGFGGAEVGKFNFERVSFGEEESAGRRYLIRLEKVRLGGCQVGIDRALVEATYQSFNDVHTYTPATQFFEGTQFPASAWGSLDPESSPAVSFPGLFYAPDPSFDNSVSQNHDNSVPINDQNVVSSYAGQPLGLGHYVNDYPLQGDNSHGYAQNQEGYSNSVVDFTTGNQNQPDFIENQALPTGLNPQAHFLGGQTNPFGVNVYENPCVESPAVYCPSSTNAVYPSQTYSDATFADFNVTGSMLWDPNVSSSMFSGPALPAQTFSGPELSASALPVQNFSADQYQPAAYQNMHFPAQDLHSSLMPDDTVLPATPPTLQCTQPSCLEAFSRDADRIRHEAAIHGTNHGLHLCPIIGCVKAQGRGYSRADKVTEHLWKKHADLGYVKRV